MPVEPVGLALAIPGVLDLCLKYGNLVCEKYRTFRDADDLFRNRILALEGRWLQIEAQIDFLKKLWHRLPSRLQVHFTHVLAWLQTLLNRATNLTFDLTATTKPTNEPAKFNILDVPAIMKAEGKLRRGAFVFNKKDALDKLITELRQWHDDMLGPSWFQILRAPDVSVDDHLPQQVAQIPQIIQLRRLDQNVRLANSSTTSSHSTMILSADAIEDQTTPIFASTVRLCVKKTTGETALLDEIHIPDSVDKQTTVVNFSQLATKLSVIDSSAMNLPECFGIMIAPQKKIPNDTVAIIFNMPRNMLHPRSLRELLMEQNQFLPLHSRLDLAVQLAKAVVSIHSIGIVHKSIRPETILVFYNDTIASPSVDPDNNTTSELKVLPFGFEQFRAADAGSLMRGDLEWRKALYRHPNRHGLHPESEYVMQHDIYSLGVCLLEIGLWSSFVLEPGDRGRPHPDFDVSSIAGREVQRKAHILKERMQQTARTKLPGKMGKRYAEVVSTCLGCLDGRNEEFGNEQIYEEDDGEIRVGIRFMETVILQLQEITV